MTRGLRGPFLVAELVVPPTAKRFRPQRSLVTPHYHAQSETSGFLRPSFDSTPVPRTEGLGGHCIPEEPAHCRSGRLLQAFDNVRVNVQGDLNRGMS